MDLKFGFKCACDWASHPWNYSKYSLQVLLGKSTEKILNEMLLFLKVGREIVYIVGIDLHNRDAIH